jgi:uncharacterized protein (DUF2235 family)
MEHEVWDSLDNILYYQNTIGLVGVQSTVSRLSKLELLSILTQGGN